jgi:hypothetical protein
VRPARRLDGKLASIAAGRYTPDDFVIADAKDAGATPARQALIAAVGSARDSARPPQRPRLTTWSTCSAWRAAARATPGPWPRSCTRSTASAAPGQAAS